MLYRTGANKCSRSKSGLACISVSSRFAWATYLFFTEQRTDLGVSDPDTEYLKRPWSFCAHPHKSKASDSACLNLHCKRDSQSYMLNSRTLTLTLRLRVHGSALTKLTLLVCSSLHSSLDWRCFGLGASLEKFRSPKGFWSDTPSVQLWLFLSIECLPDLELTLEDAKVVLPSALRAFCRGCPRWARIWAQPHDSQRLCLDPEVWVPGFCDLQDDPPFDTGGALWRWPWLCHGCSRGSTESWLHRYDTVSFEPNSSGCCSESAAEMARVLYMLWSHPEVWHLTYCFIGNSTSPNRRPANSMTITY